jgi:hypothetical protein
MQKIWDKQKGFERKPLFNHSRHIKLPINKRGTKMFKPMYVVAQISNVLLFSSDWQSRIGAGKVISGQRH